MCSGILSVTHPTFCAICSGILSVTHPNFCAICSGILSVGLKQVGHVCYFVDCSLVLSLTKLNCSWIQAFLFATIHEKIFPLFCYSGIGSVLSVASEAILQSSLFCVSSEIVHPSLIVCQEPNFCCSRIC